MARTPKLSDMQLILLATACQRDNGSILPPADSLGDQVVRIRKAVAGLIKRNLANEIDVAEPSRSWREEDDRHIGVVITDAGRAIIAAKEKVENAPLAECQGAPGGAPPPIPPDANPVSTVAAESELDVAAVPPMRPGTKQALVVDLLRSDAGASLGELAGATGWLPHTMRAALTGLRKRGFAIAMDKADRATRYRIAAGGRS